MTDITLTQKQKQLIQQALGYINSGVINKKEIDDLVNKIEKIEIKKTILSYNELKLIRKNKLQKLNRYMCDNSIVLDAGDILSLINEESVNIYPEKTIDVTKVISMVYEQQRLEGGSKLLFDLLEAMNCLTRIQQSRHESEFKKGYEAMGKHLSNIICGLTGKKFTYHDIKEWIAES